MKVSRSSVGNDAMGCTWAQGTERLIRYSEMEVHLHIYGSHAKTLHLYRRFWIRRLKSVYFILLFSTSSQWPNCSISCSLTPHQMPLTIRECLLIFSQFPTEAIRDPYAKSLTRLCDRRGSVAKVQGSNFEDFYQ